MTKRDLLVLGRAFERFFVDAYGIPDDADLQMRVQVPILKSLGSARWEPPTRPITITGLGFVDVLMCYDDSGLRAHVIVEVKNTAWDLIAPSRLGRLLGRHRRQVWGYLEPLLLRVDAAQLAGPQAFTVYPQCPTRPGLAELVQNELENYGIVPVYADELLDTAAAGGVELRRGSCDCGSLLTEVAACDQCDPHVRVRSVPAIRPAIRRHQYTCPGLPGR